MKQKQTNIYLLLVAVVAIWSVVAYKLFYTSNTLPIAETMIQPMLAVPNNGGFEQFEIVADYRDPFLTSGKTKAVTRKKKKKKTPKPPVVFPKIKYAGVLKSNDAYRFLIEIDRQQYFFQIKDTFKDVTLVSGDKNQISVVYQSVQKDFAFKE